MLGLRKDANLLVDHQSGWAAAFEEERARIAAALGGLAKGIAHCGSTAVPGLVAKPILDIYVGVQPIDDWRACRAPLEALGYDYAENAGVPGSHIFGRGRDSSERSHLLHVVEFGGSSWLAAIAFRDRLRTESSLRDAYRAVKEAALDGSDGSRARYNELKSAFFDDLRAGRI
jgi:GrpB-like predicted nucleotidyltransferase (UPF0157 family)